MKNALILGVLAAVLSVGSVPANAQSTQTVQNTQVAQRCPHCGKYHAPRTQRRVYYAQPQKQNMMSRMWQMEQRKNAWLMRTFFGR